MPNEKPPSSQFTEILTRAIEGGADAIDLEYEGGGELHVFFMSGNTGAGFGLRRDEPKALIDCLWDDDEPRKKIPFALHGINYIVRVKTRDQFGDYAYRLTIKPAKE